jgi:hypothetical protein
MLTHFLVTTIRRARPTPNHVQHSIASDCGRADGLRVVDIVDLLGQQRREPVI